MSILCVYVQAKHRKTGKINSPSARLQVQLRLIICFEIEIWLKPDDMTMFCFPENIFHNAFIMGWISCKNTQICWRNQKRSSNRFNVLTKGIRLVRGIVTLDILTWSSVFPFVSLCSRTVLNLCTQSSCSLLIFKAICKMWMWRLLAELYGWITLWPGVPGCREWDLSNSEGAATSLWRWYDFTWLRYLAVMPFIGQSLLLQQEEWKNGQHLCTWVKGRVVNKGRDVIAY